MIFTRPSRPAPARLLPLFSLLLTLCLVSCDSDPASPAPEAPDTVSIGGLFSRTGNWSTLGKAASTALELAVDDVNAYQDDHGSSLRFAFQVADTKLDPAQAYDGLVRLHRDGVDLFVGPQSSSELARLKGYSDSNHVMIVSPSSTAGSLAKPGDGIYRFCAADVHEAEATGALMAADTITEVIPIWRDDAGNAGLVTGLRTALGTLGIQIASGVSYTDATDVATTVAAAKAQVADARARRGDAGTAVYLASFDEGAAILAAAKNDPDLSAVRWYAGDGIAQSEVLLANAPAAEAAAALRMKAALLGLDAASAERRADIAARIRAIVGYEPDAFALNVYDAIWVMARAAMARNGNTGDTFGQELTRQAASYYGATGWTVLDANGDRKYGDFDFWEVAANAGTWRWKSGAHYSGLTRQLTR